jgi:hypothetical protein
MNWARQEIDKMTGGGVAAPARPPRKQSVKRLLRLSEKQVTEQCVGYMRGLGYIAERRNAGLADFGARGKVRYGQSGAADYIFLHPVRPAIYVEFKREGETIRPHQEIMELHLRNPKSKALKHEFEQAGFLHGRRIRGFRAFWCNGLEMLIKELNG